jgi:hypothetical protein
VSAVGPAGGVGHASTPKHLAEKPKPRRGASSRVTRDGIKLVGGTKLHSRRVTTSERELDCSELRAAIGQIEMGRLRWIVCRDDFVILRE